MLLTPLILRAAEPPARQRPPSAPPPLLSASASAVHAADCHYARPFTDVCLPRQMQRCFIISHAMLFFITPYFSCDGAKDRALIFTFC